MSYSYDFEPFERNFMSQYSLVRSMSYLHVIEIFEKDSMTRNMSQTCDFETNKNPSHKQSVLFYGPIYILFSHKKF